MAQSGAERVTLDLHQATMDAFAQEIKAQAGYTFFYNDSLAKAIEPITLSVKDELLTSVLDKVLGPKGYTFTIEAGTNWTLIVLLVVLGLLVSGGLVFFFIRRKKVADQDEA